MKQVYPIQFVSLGPGDPELITLKGLRLLQQADCVFCPATGNGQASKAADIVKALGISPDKINLYDLPMKRDRTASLAAYDRLCRTASGLQEEGKRVVITAEGDAGFYSSSHYAYERLLQNGSKAENVPGIPAFIAAGAKAGIHVVSGAETLAVLPGTATADELNALLGKGCTVVIMKLSACADSVKSYVSTHRHTECHYFERLGMSDEYVSTDIETILGRSFPYFSLMILKPGPAGQLLSSTN